MDYKFDFGGITITSSTDNDSLVVSAKKFIGSKSISIPKTILLQALTMLAAGKDTVAMASFVARKDGTYYKLNFDLLGVTLTMNEKEAGSIRAFLLGEGK